MNLWFSVFIIILSSTFEVIAHQRIGIFPGSNAPVDQFYIDYEAHSHEAMTEVIDTQLALQIQTLEENKRRLCELEEKLHSSEHQKNLDNLEKQIAPIQESLRAHEKVLALLENISSLQEIQSLYKEIEDDVDELNMRKILDEISSSVDGTFYSLTTCKEMLGLSISQREKQISILLHGLQSDFSEVDQIKSYLKAHEPTSDDRIVSFKNIPLTKARYVIRKKMKRYYRYRICELKQDLGDPTFIDYRFTKDTLWKTKDGWQEQYDSFNHLTCYLPIGSKHIFFGDNTIPQFKMDDSYYWSLWVFTKASLILLELAQL